MASQEPGGDDASIFPSLAIAMHAQQHRIVLDYFPNCFPAPMC